MHNEGIVSKAFTRTSCCLPFLTKPIFSIVVFLTFFYVILLAITLSTSVQYSAKPVMMSSGVACSKKHGNWMWPSDCGGQGGYCHRAKDDTHLQWLRETVSDQSIISEEELSEIKYLLLFLGHGRSGGSITGQLLDSHPNILVANQYMLLHEMVLLPSFYQNKSSIVKSLIRASEDPDKSLRHIRASNHKGYKLNIGTQSIAGNKDHVPLMIVGDKGAGMTVGMYLKEPDKFKNLLGRIKATMGVPLKFIEVIRNPFDNIATQVIYESGGAGKRKRLVENGWKLTHRVSELVDCDIDKYFTETFATMRMVEELKLDILQVHLADLITDPQRELHRICDFLELECVQSFLVNCEDKLFKELSKTRTLINWTVKQKRIIKQLLQKVPYLRRYSYNSDC